MPIDAGYRRLHSGTYRRHTALLLLNVATTVNIRALGVEFPILLKLKKLL
jgi:hypothetical protein